MSECDWSLCSVCYVKKFKMGLVVQATFDCADSSETLNFCMNEIVDLNYSVMTYDRLNEHKN